MRLANEELLASSLEEGLGEIDWLCERINPHMRLRMVGVCGLVSAAIAEHIEGSRLVVSQPELSVDPTMNHVVAIVPTDENQLMIDASYTQFLSYAGLTPGYIHHGGVDTFPKEKIAAFEYGRQHNVVKQLTRSARIAIDGYVAPDDKYYNPRVEFKSFTDDEIHEQYDAIWNPKFFTDFSISHEQKVLAERLASYIPSHALELVD
jgi:hypothetical protein